MSFLHKLAACARFIVLVKLALLLFRISVFAQPKEQAGTYHRNLRFDHLTVADGLSQGMVNAIHQDGKGFLWFGSKDGLNRYDGYNFRVFRNDPFDSTSISGNHITAITEDRFGRFWIGTFRNGLNCFDPATEKFRRFRFNSDDPNCTSCNEISVICEAPSDRDDQNTTLWIGTRNGLYELVLTENFAGTGGVTQKTRLNSRLAFDYTLTHDFHNPEDSSSIVSDAIEDLLIDRAKVLWIATADGLNSLDLKTSKSGGDRRFQRFVSKDGDEHSLISNVCTALYESVDGALWVGTQEGLSKLVVKDRSPIRFQNYRYPKEILAETESWQRATTDIASDQKGRLWLALKYCLMIFNPVPHEEGFQYYRSRKDDPWSLSFSGVTSVFRDKNNLMWVGTGGFGLNKYDPRKAAFQTFTGSAVSWSGPSEVRLNIFTRDAPDKLRFFLQNNIYIFGFDRGTGAFQPRRVINFPQSQIISDRLDNIWALQPQAFYRYDPNAQKLRDFIPDSAKKSIDLHSVFEDADGGIWIAGFTKKRVDQPSSILENVILGSWDRNAKKLFWHAIDLPEAGANLELKFTGGLRNRNGMFWFAGTHGLYRIDLRRRAARIYLHDPTNPRSLNQNTLKTVLADPVYPERFLWLGSDGGGLNRFEIANETFTHHTAKNGLPNDVVYGILADSRGNLWMSTNRGLSNAMLNPETRDILRFKNYRADDGLQGDEFNTDAYFQTERGDMVFGGLNGLTIFHPDSIEDNPNPPPVVFTDFQVHHQSVRPGAPDSPLRKAISETDKITLAHSDHTISFEFSALDFAKPEKNLYSYMLENFDSDWSPPSHERKAIYNHVNPGKYVFHVRAANSDGVWNEVGAAIKITVTPPWWRTWQAYLIAALLLIGVLYAIHLSELNRYRLRHRIELEYIHAEKEHVEAEKLKELDRLKSRFFANISHEFRTPLTLIIGPLEHWIEEKRIDRNLRRQAGVMRRNARQLLHLINQLLDLSKIEAGGMRMSKVTGDVIPLLKNLTYSFESLARDKKITLTFKTTHETLIVPHDPDSIEKIMYNLLSNAFKFTPEGGRISVQASVSSEKLSKRIEGLDAPEQSSIDHCLLIIVKDSGVGIPKKQLPHIFDRFYQVDGSQTRAHSGTGIGLALTKELVKLHGGDLSVESEKGKGSTFTVRLPIFSDRYSVSGDQSSAASGQYSVTSEQETGTPSAPKPAAPSKHGEIVLIVEDNADVRAYIAEHLQDRYTILQAEDGEQGFVRAQEAIPDLIITDVMMPGIDGYELCRMLRADEKTSHVPIIMLTARAAKEDMIAGLETGVDAYVIKPFSPKEIQVRVRKLIEMRRKLRRRFAQTPGVHPSEIAATPVDQQFLERLQALVEKEMGDDEFQISRLYRRIGMSDRQLRRKLHALLNISPKQYLRKMRLQRGKQLLEQRAGNVTEIAFRVGYGSAASFSKAFHDEFGRPPSAFLRKPS